MFVTYICNKIMFSEDFVTNLYQISFFIIPY